jgi:hypothetical protein
VVNDGEPSNVLVVTCRDDVLAALEILASGERRPRERESFGRSDA